MNLCNQVNDKVKCCNDERAQWRKLSADSEDFSKTSVDFDCTNQLGFTYLLACSNDGGAKCMRVSLRQWHDTGKKTKWVGTNKQTKKKDKTQGSKMHKKKKTQRDIHQHKHWSKWLIFFCTTEFKCNEKQHNMWIKYASENWSSKKTERVQFNQAVFYGVNCGVARKLKCL